MTVLGNHAQYKLGSDRPFHGHLQTISWSFQMPIETHRTDVQFGLSAVEIARSNVVAKRDISIKEKKLLKIVKNYK